MNVGGEIPMQREKKLISVLFCLLGAILLGGAFYIALTGAFGLSWAARCVLLLLVGAFACKEQLRLLWNHCRKGTAIDWKDPWILFQFFLVILWIAVFLGFWFRG